MPPSGKPASITSRKKLAACRQKRTSLIAGQGPFTVVETKYIPRAIITVPAKYWKTHPHGAPPGQVKKASQTKAKSNKTKK